MYTKVFRAVITLHNRNKNVYQIKIITMMKNYYESVEINCNPNWRYISGYAYRILIIDGSGSRKTHMLLISIKLDDKILTKFI